MPGFVLYQFIANFNSFNRTIRFSQINNYSQVILFYVIMPDTLYISTAPQTKIKCSLDTGENYWLNII